MTRVADSMVPAPIVFPRVCRGIGLRLVSVTGGKGGVGKSTVSANLAVALGALGGRVLLVDGDLGMANADQMLGVHVATTLFDVVKAEVTLEDAIVETPFGVSILSASSGRREMAELDGHTRRALLDSIAQLGDQFDYVVIDTAAGIGGVSLDFSAAADLVLAVATPDPASVRDVFAIMKVLSKEKGIKRINLLANMVGSKAEGIDLYRRISGVAARFLPVSLGLAGVVVKDPMLERAVRERLPVSKVFPNAQASTAFSNVATQVLTMDRELRDGAITDGQGGSSEQGETS